MRHANTALEDDALLLIIQQELAKRRKKSKTRDRNATPAEVVLRMLLLKHVCDWSYETLSREVRANLVYREFTRIGGEKVPDDRTMANLARQLGPEVIEKLHRRVVEIAQENKIATGRKMRVDTTVDVAHSAIRCYHSENIDCCPSMLCLCGTRARFLILSASLRIAYESKASIGFEGGSPARRITPHKRHWY